MSSTEQAALQEQQQEQAAQAGEQLMLAMQPTLFVLMKRLREALHGNAKEGTPPVIEPRHISHKPKGKNSKKRKPERDFPGDWITFMSHHHRKGYMDYLVGQWGWKLDPPVVANGRLYMIGHLTIFGCDGQLTRSASGTEELSCSSYGDPSSNAEAMAFGRACMAFGLCRSWWDKS